MKVIRLPTYVFEDGLPGFLAALWRPPPDQALAVDFARAKFYIPAAVAMLITRIDFAKRLGATVELQGLEQCENLRYLQRIDFFDQLGMKIPEAFTRHGEGNAFVPLREVIPGPVATTNETVATELARCVADHDGNDVFQLSQYALGEIIANVKQHAGERGFVCAQYMPSQDVARIGIADSGVGIRESFRAHGAPRYRPDMSDAQVLELAMSPWSSSKAHLKGAYGGSPNRGVGLTLTRFMVAQSYGHFFLASGNAWWFRNGMAPEKSGVLPEGCRVEGTALSLGYQRAQVEDYLSLRRQAWDSLLLTPEPDPDILFT